jgi:predicted secreted protein
MTNAVLTAGTKVGLGDGASPEVFNLIPQVSSVTTPELSRGSIEVTSLDSTSKEYISGLADSGSFNLEGYWDSGNAQHVALRAAAIAGTAKNVLITFPDSPQTKVLFATFPETFALTAEPDAPIAFSVTLKVSGALDWTTTESVV